MKPSLSTIALILLAGGVAVTAAAGPSLAREGEVAATVSGAPVTPAELDKRIGNRLLPMFAEAGEVNCVRALLEKNPSWLNVSDSEYGATALHWAVLRRQVDVVSLLMSAGADVNARDETQETPPQVAQRAGRAEVVDALSGQSESRI